MKINKKKKSIFEEVFVNKTKTEWDPEKQKEYKLQKIESFFEELADKSNRIFFYCPDIPFAVGTVKIIYETVYMLRNSGYNAILLHEIKGYNPEWLTVEWKKELPKEFLSEKKKNKYTTPELKFKPTDTIVVPDGFWTVMKAFEKVKPVQKVVYALGYAGLSTTEPGFNWGSFGFNTVICLNQTIMEDYKSLWPELTYKTVTHWLDKDLYQPVEDITDIYPAIALNVRDKKKAIEIINIFTSRYPFLSMFQFKILKKLSLEDYINVLKHCCLHVLIDEDLGAPLPPLESVALKIPILTVFGRGYETIAVQDEKQQVKFLDDKDSFVVAEQIAEFCLGYLSNPTLRLEDNQWVLDLYSKEKAQGLLLEVFDYLQEEKIKTFVAIKNAVEEGKIKEDNLTPEKIENIN